MTADANQLPELATLWAATKEPPSSPKARRRPLDTARVLAGVPEGERDDDVWRLAGKLRGADVPQWAAEELARTAAANSTPPFPEADAIEKVRRAYAEYPAGSLGDDEVEWSPPAAFDAIDVPTFPADALPEPLRKFVVEESLATQTPVDLAALTALGISAAATAAKVIVEPTAGWLEGANLFVAVALQSGERKSAVHRDVAAPIRKWERDMAARKASAIAKYRATRSLLEARLAAATRNAANATEDAKRKTLAANAIRLAAKLAALQPVVAPRRCVDDCTPEKLAMLLSAHGSQIAIVSAEGGVFTMIAGRYSKNVPNLDVYTKGHANEDIVVDRVGREPLHVPAPALSMVLALQPSVVAGLGSHSEFRDQGLNARFLFAIPKGRVGFRDTAPHPMSQATRAAYDDCITRLLDIQPPLDALGVPQPHVLHLSPEGAARFAEFRDSIETRLREDGDLASLKDWGSKLPGAVARIAGLLHMVENAQHPEPWATPISENTMANAIQIGEYLVPHARLAALAAPPP